MQRYFVEQLNSDGQIEMTGNDFFHLKKVMRCQIGDEFYAVVAGKTVTAEIVLLAENHLFANPKEWLDERVELPIQVTLACGLPKADKLEWIVQKSTELGVYEIVPFTATRSVVKWDSGKATKKVDRLKKIAKEAAEQAHRTIIPSVLPVMDLPQLVAYGKQFDVCLVAYEESARVGEKAQLAVALEQAKRGQKWLVVFGPEGGLDEKEVAVLLENGFQTCGLGSRILRAETAPLYVMSAIGFSLELK